MTPGQTDNLLGAYFELLARVGKLEAENALLWFEAIEQALPSARIFTQQALLALARIPEAPDA